MEFLEIESQRAITLHAQGLTQHRGRDERIPVAIAANPGSDPQERSELGVIPGQVDTAELVLQCGVEPGQLPQERVIVIGKTIGNLVEDCKLGSAQNVRLPQREHGAAQRLVNCGSFLWGKLDAIPLRQ